MRNKSTFWSVLLVCLVTVFYQSFAQSNCSGVNLLTNASFENPVISTVTQANATVPGWSSNVPIQIVRPSGADSRWPSTGADGAQFLDLANPTGAGWLQQEFTIEDATQLHFSASFANREVNSPSYVGGQIAIQILNTDANVAYAAESSVLNASNGYNWITLNGLTNVLNPGTYLFRVFATTNFAHFDNFIVCKSIDAALACPSPKVLTPKSTWSASASSELAGYEAARAIDGSVRDVAGDYRAWAGGSPSGSIDQHITFDYGTALNLVGFVYYPRTAVRQDISKYTIHVSNDGVTFTEVQSGSIRRQNDYMTVVPPVTNVSTGEPLEVHFTEAVSARYMRFIVRGMHQTGYAAIAEMLPIVCEETTTIENVISCANANLLNTGTNASGTGKDVLDTFDANWEVAFVQDKGATALNLLPDLSSIEELIFKPAIVTGNKVPASWANSPYGNAEWISYTTTSRDVDGITNDPANANTYFFRYRFKIEDAYLLPAFKLRLNFLTDNFVKNIYINGNALAGELGLPSGGFTLANQNVTSLHKHWKLGDNEIIIQVYSQPPYAGFLGQNITTCPGIDFGDAPASYNVSRNTFGAGHLLETNSDGDIVLKLGDLVDGEADGVASTDAMSDDNNGLSDEDGVDLTTLPAIDNSTLPTIASYAINVKVTNITGYDANLCGWIDWNENGVFDDNERACVVVPNNATQATLNWSSVTFNGSTNNNKLNVYMRFRITTDELTSPNGAASNGEVEDYYPAIPLPVKLKSLHATQTENHITLMWNTVREENADRYEVERSNDGKHWTVLGKVAAFGESTTERNYSFVDQTPLKGANLYRLKMIDRDHSFEHSRMVSVDFTNTIASVYPNPVASRLLVDQFEQVQLVTLYNLAGEQVLRSSSVAAEGIDVSRLPAGMYVVKINYHNSTEKIDKVVITK